MGSFEGVRSSIDPGYNGLLVNTWNNGAINGIQLRQVPEPSTLALLAIGGAVTVLWRRRTR
jgi:hypothetical protein